MSDIFNMSDISNKHVFFSLDPNYSLAKNIAKNLGVELADIKVTTFADGEIFCQPLVSVRNKQVFIIQSLAPPVNENIMKLLIAIDALKRASVKEINVVIPYFAYARQDRKVQGRSPITAKLVSDLLSTAGANKLILVELHSDQIQGFFNVPIDHLLTIYCICTYIKKNIDIKNAVIVAPDFGAVKKARNVATMLDLPLAIIDKRRERANEAECISVFGNVKDKDCILVDDMIDTGGTVIQAVKLLKKFGSSRNYVCATHGLFSANALDKFEKSIKDKDIEQVLVTNTIELKERSFLKIMDISEFLSEIIDIYIKNEGSISALYAKYRQKILDS